LSKCSHVYENVQKCAKMCKNVQKCAKMFKNVQKCAKMCKNVQKCAKMCKNVQKCGIEFHFVTENAKSDVVFNRHLSTMLKILAPSSWNVFTAFTNNLLSTKDFWPFQNQFSIQHTGGSHYMRSFICNFVYMRLKNGLCSWNYPLIYGNPWFFICEFIICKHIFGVPISPI